MVLWCDQPAQERVQPAFWLPLLWCWLLAAWLDTR